MQERLQTIYIFIMPLFGIIETGIAQDCRNLDGMKWHANQESGRGILHVKL